MKGKKKTNQMKERNGINRTTPSFEKIRRKLITIEMGKCTCLGRELGAEAFAEEDGVAVHEETEAALDAID